MLIEALVLGPAHVAGRSRGGTVVLELYRRHPHLVATLIMIDTYAGWKGSLSAAELRTRLAAAQEMLSAPPEHDPTPPGLFAGAPPADTLLVWGELDAGSPLSVARQFDEAIPDTELVVIAGAGHMSNLEQPEGVNQSIRQFCRAHPPALARFG